MNGDDRIPNAANQSAESSNVTSAFAAESPARAHLAQADGSGASAACRELFADLVGRYCMATLGDQALARDTAEEVWTRFGQDLSGLDLTRTLRSLALGLARRRCASHLESARVRPDAATAEGLDSKDAAGDSPSRVARRLLARLRPSERELLILRHVCRLTYTELGPLWESSETDARTRLSQALVRAIAVASGQEPVHGHRDQFNAHLAEIIDKTAAPELLELIANDDELRDARHEAEGLVQILSRAADDYLEHPKLADTTAVQPIPKAGLDPATHPEGPGPTKSDPKSDARVETASEGRRVAVWIALSVAAVLAIAILSWSQASKKEQRPGAPLGSMRGTVAKIDGGDETSRVEVCRGDQGTCRIAVPGMRVDTGMLLRTNSRARASIDLDSNASITLGRATVVVLSEHSRSHLGVKFGTIVVDTHRDGAETLVVEFPLGRAELEHAKCAITVEATHTLLEVASGRVRLFDKSNHETTLSFGETGRLTPNHDTTVTYSQSVGDAIADGEFTDGESIDARELSRGLGELRAKKPGESSERDNAVKLARHHVKVHIVGPIARTEVDETFSNETNDVLEGIFRFPLPADAQIERLALEVDGRLVDGAFTDRERASAIWRGSIVQAAPQLRAQIRDEIIWVPGPWRDPALLEWQRGNRFELRIYPIPKHGSRRVVLAYTQVVSGSTGARRYNYPLPKQAAELRGIAEFSFDLELRGHDASRPPAMLGYAGKLSSPSREVANFRLNEPQFVPHGDLVVDYELPQGQRDLVAWAHQSANSNEKPQVAMLLRPRLPSAREQSSRTYAFVVDTSRSMFGESLRRAATLTVRMIRELASDDRVVVLACDSECRQWPDGLLKGGGVAAESAQRYLQMQSAEGASDLVGAIDSAVAALGHGSSTSQHIVYVGDGTPTVGPTRPATIARGVSRRFGTPGLSVTAVAVGADSDLESLRALARAGRGVVVPYVPGTSVTRASYAVLAATSGARLVDAQIELPKGVVGIAPEVIGTVAAGDELLVVGQLTNTEIRGDVVLRGRVDDRDFEQRYAVDLRAVMGDSNAFVPRLYAATRIFDLERRGDSGAKKAAIELSQRYSVASRYTSLLVLESQAMFDAFALDNRQKSEIWTGELEASAISSSSADEETQPDAYSAASATPKVMRAPTRRRASAGAAPFADFAAAAAPASIAAEPSGAQTAAAKPKAADEARESEWSPPPSLPRQRMIPMRRIWERRGEVLPRRTQPSTVSQQKIAAAERDLAQNPHRRAGVKQLYDLYAKSGELAQAHNLVEQWSQRDPLDVEALVARADLAARRGERAVAIRILGSVVDVRPSDIGAQQRLSRLYRWQGQSELACRFSLALAEFRPSDEKTLAEALRCLNESNHSELVEELKRSVVDGVLRLAEQLLHQPRAVDRLSGDLRLMAHWQGSGVADVDLALVDPDAHRVSWLGAPTRAVISATNVTSESEEGLALRGGKPGEYLLEVSRGRGAGRVQGTVTIYVAGSERVIPFILEGDRVSLGIIKITTIPKLVPLAASTAFRLGE